MESSAAQNAPPAPLIGVVGPCASGKSTLVKALKAHGLNAKHIGQEHSGVPDMWQRLGHPDVLIYLDVSEQAATGRRGAFNNRAWLAQQHRRLAHARARCDLYLLTDGLSPQAVLERVLSFLALSCP